LLKYQQEKERAIRQAEKEEYYKMNPDEAHKRELMKDPGYRKALGVIIHAGGDAHDVLSVENS
jgi:hypothetical protein